MADADSLACVVLAALLAAPFVAVSLVATALAIRARLAADVERSEAVRLLGLLRAAAPVLVVQRGKKLPGERARAE